jgi:hypothetical protein
MYIPAVPFLKNCRYIDYIGELASSVATGFTEIPIPADCSMSHRVINMNYSSFVCNRKIRALSNW